MRTGVVFDIKEFAVHDGPGVRVSVFLKGCPLRCSWCHNPEGLSPEPQKIHSAAGERMAGEVFTSAELAERLNSQADMLRAAEGGVTFCGGEPLAQAEFVAEVMDQLSSLHVLLDTSGHAPEREFCMAASRADLVYFDLKLIDAGEHRHHTGCGNESILSNLHRLSAMNVPFVVRVPLIPGVTDTEVNLDRIARTVEGLPGLQRVDLLPYNRAAGAKYAACGLEFKPTFDPLQPVNANVRWFESAGIPVRIL